MNLSFIAIIIVSDSLKMSQKIVLIYGTIIETAKRNAEMLGLMVNDPNVKPKELAAIKAKTLVIAGTKDMVKDSHTRLIAASIPNAELVLLKGDHFIAAKIPQEFNRAVLDFLG